MYGFCKIENVGEVPINAFRLLGASTKEDDDTKIGYFGSGIKYALASALREGIPLRVFSGSKEILITLKKENMGDMEFDVICINKVPTSLTTRMGKDWKPWFIFREFYCNALDAGGIEYGVCSEDEVSGQEGKTRIYLGIVPQMKAVLDSFDAYFSEKRTPMLEVGNNKVFYHYGEGMRVYRKGILVFYSNHQSLYDYDFETLEINEARTASDFECQYAIATFWKNSATTKMIGSLIENLSSFEFDVLNWSYGPNSMGSAWLEALKGRVIIPREFGGQYHDDMQEGKRYAILPHKVCELLHRTFGDKLKIRGFQKEKSELVILPANQKQLNFIKDASEFLANSGFFDLQDYPISIAVLERRQLGEAKDGQIFLSPELFEQGKREVVKTILEEYVHCKTLASDNTRFMQETLLNMVVAAYEEKQGVYL